LREVPTVDHRRPASRETDKPAGGTGVTIGLAGSDSDAEDKARVKASVSALRAGRSRSMPPLGSGDIACDVRRIVQ
jgi:hypothetical protein